MVKRRLKRKVLKRRRVRNQLNKNRNHLLKMKMSLKLQKVMSIIQKKNQVKVLR